MHSISMNIMVITSNLMSDHFPCLCSLFSQIISWNVYWAPDYGLGTTAGSTDATANSTDNALTIIEPVVCRGYIDNKQVKA